MRIRFVTAVLVLLSMFGSTVSLRAQYGAEPDSEQQYPAAQQDYPEAQPYPQQGVSRQDQGTDEQGAVARLSIVQGDVNVKRGDSGDLLAAAINAPLLTQDHVQTSPGSRAEVQLDYANMIRLAPNTDLGFANLEYHQYQLQLGAGSIIYRVLRPSDAQAEIDTPSIALRSTQQGDYRISVLDDGSTQISVRSGQLEVYSPRGTQRIEAGQTMLVRGDSSDPEFQMTGQMELDQFDDWSANRDRQLLASQSYQHVSPDIYGADDLDTYGNWVPSQYGNVWAPRSVGSDWAPYSTGHWVWEGYYGWTWVDDAPWGWAPYHYGRWFNNPGYGWCWWPGSVASSYAWSPALVGFFGWGGGLGVGVGVGFGEIGWVALAPFEVFHPWWGHGFYGRGFGRGYGNYTNINIVRNTNITNIYRNASVKGGVVACPSKKFGQPNQNFGRATTGQLRNASLFRGQMPVTPTRTSRQFSNRQATANPRLASVANRTFYQGPQLSRSVRGSSVQQQMRTQPGARMAGNTTPIGRNGGFARTGQPALNTQRGQAPTTSRGGASMLAQNSRNAATPGAATMPRTGPTQASAPGWRRFGETGAQRGQQIPSMSRGTFANGRQDSRMNGPQPAAVPQSSHGVPPNQRSQTAGRGNYGASTKTPAGGGWQRFGEPGNATAFRSTTQLREQSGWHSFGQPQRTAPGTYSGARPSSVRPQPSYGRSFGAPNYGGNYQSRPLGANQPAPRPPQSSPGYRSGYNYGARPGYAAPSFGGMSSPRAAPSMPHYSAPSAPHYSAPSAPHYSAPPAPHYSAPSAPRYSAPRGGGGGGFHGGGSPRSGGSSNSGHSSSGGQRSR